MTPLIILPHLPLPVPASRPAKVIAPIASVPGDLRRLWGPPRLSPLGYVLYCYWFTSNFHACIQAVIPLTHGYRKDLTDVTIDRLNVAVNLYRPNQGYYSVSKLPSLLTWGPGNGSSLPTDNSRYITEASSSRTRVLIIGEVTKAFLRGTETNRGSCSINVAPLFTADAERLADLVQGFSTSSKGL